MEEFFAEAILSERKSLCIGTLTREEAVNSGGDVPANGVGLYLFANNLQNPASPPEVLARLVSEEAANALAVLLRAKGGE
ncbi:hypothetical protein [Azospirillum palustre]